MIRLIAILFAVVFGAGAVQAQIVEREDNLDVVLTEHDLDMINAIQAARDSLDYFFYLQDTVGDYFGDSAIKVGLPSGDGQEEHIWVKNPRKTATGFTGFLNNEPYDLADDMQLGDKVSFTKDMVTDWAFLEGEKYRGHFTTRILIKTYPQETIDAFLDGLHSEPVPADFK